MSTSECLQVVDSVLLADLGLVFLAFFFGLVLSRLTK